MSAPRRAWAAPPLLHQGRVLILDVEGTGLLPDPEAHPVELAAVLLDLPAGKVLAEFTTLIAPPVLRDKHRDVIQKFCHLTPQDLLLAPSGAEVRKRFRHWRLAVAPRVPATSYNTTYDRAILDRYLLAPDLVWGGCIYQMSQDYLFSGGLVLPGRGTATLQAVASKLGIPLPEEQHRALPDAKLAAEILMALYCFDFRPPQISLGQAPMGGWFLDSDPTFPLPLHPKDTRGWSPLCASALAWALVTTARRRGVREDPSWFHVTDPMADIVPLVQYIPDDVWLDAYRFRVTRIPALREALLWTRTIPLSGHGRAPLWTQVRTELQTGAL